METDSGKKILFGIAVLGLVAFFLFNYFNSKRSANVVSPVAQRKTTTESSDSNLNPPMQDPPTSPVSNSQGLEQAVSGALAGTHGTYAIVIKNLKTGESYELNSHQVFETGSLYKLWVMAVVYQQVEQGKIKLGEVVSSSVEDLNKQFHIPDEESEETSGSYSFTVSQALSQMITISHNYAALLLTKRIGLTSIQPFLRANGLMESKVGVNGAAPTSTASDIGTFLSKLYDGKLANDTSTAAMIELLKQQRLNDVLPKYLPDDLLVAHKTGNINLFYHDAGIVYSDSGDYIIVTMSKSDNPQLAEERMALVSKAVYDYFLAH